jgi:RNA polymerase sigma-70 factor (ECF subfamily)
MVRVARSTKEIEDLAARMVASKEQAFVEFADTFGPRFRSFFLKKGLSPSNAEDLAVSCITDIALKVEKYKAIREGGFEAWVFTLARNALIDWLRTQSNSEPLPDDLAAPTFSDDEIEPELDIVLAVGEALAQLSETDQTLVRLRHLVEEHTYAEIGERVGISPETARVRHFRALKRLKALLEKDERISRLLLRRMK